MSESSETIEEVYKPFLIQQGFIMRTPRGREVTELVYKHLWSIKGAMQGDCFNNNSVILNLFKNLILSL